jgi:hypothetical protein
MVAEQSRQLLSFPDETELQPVSVFAGRSRTLRIG